MQLGLCSILKWTFFATLQCESNKYFASVLVGYLNTTRNKNQNVRSDKTQWIAHKLYVRLQVVIFLALCTVGAHEESGKLKQEEQNDGKNFALLTFLYFLQGVPMGICAVLPMLLMVCALRIFLFLLADI